MSDDLTQTAHLPASTVATVLREASYDHIAELGRRLLEVSLCAVCLGPDHRWLSLGEGVSPEHAALALSLAEDADAEAQREASVHTLNSPVLNGSPLKGRMPNGPASAVPSFRPVVRSGKMGTAATAPICVNGTEHVGLLRAIDFDNRVFKETDIRALAHLGACVSRELTLGLRCATDPLTGVLARTAFLDSLDVGLDDGAVALAILDLDSFKAINDTFGHVNGDTVLSGTGALMRRELDTAQIQIGRLGGEEFGLLFCDMTMGEVIGTLHSLRQALSGLVFESVGGIRVTASIGVTAITPGRTRAELLYRADLALYRAKRFGKDRVETAEASEGLPTPIARRHRDAPVRQHSL